MVKKNNHHSMTNLKYIKNFKPSDYFKYKENLLKLSFFNIYYYK